MDAPLVTPMPATGDRPHWGAAAASDPFATLMATKRRCIVPLLALSFGFVIAMTLMAGFAKDFMAQKVLGAFNVGYLMILMTYVLCWVVALIYVRTANRKFDAQAAAAIAALKTGRPA